MRTLDAMGPRRAEGGGPEDGAELQKRVWVLYGLVAFVISELQKRV
jgi:hypothetical protein